MAKNQDDADTTVQPYSALEIFQKTLLAADLSLSKRLAFCSSGGRLRPLMKLLEISCHGIPWISATVYIVMKTQDPSHEEVFFNLLIALLLDLIIVGSTKLLCRRKRPAYNRGDMFATVSVDNYSFPSGHATRAYMVTWFILYHLKLAVPLRALLQIWCHLVGFSRVFLGRHHISDVVAGFAIGYFQFMLIEKYWINYQQCKMMLDYVK